MHLSQTSKDFVRKEGGDRLDGAEGGVIPRVLPLGKGGSSTEASMPPLSPDHLSSDTGRDYMFNMSMGAWHWL